MVNIIKPMEDDRQRLIVRQSCLDRSIDYLKLIDKPKPSMKDIFDVAETLEEWVFRK
jgi:hypothetical protein